MRMYPVRRKTQLKFTSMDIGAVAFVAFDVDSVHVLRLISSKHLSHRSSGSGTPNARVRTSQLGEMGYVTNHNQ